MSTPYHPAAFFACFLSETAMGERINAQRKDDSEYVKAVYELGLDLKGWPSTAGPCLMMSNYSISRMTNLILQRMTNPLLRIGFIHNLLHGRRETRLLKILHGFTDRVIQHRKEERNNRNANNPEVGSSKIRWFGFPQIVPLWEFLSHFPFIWIGF